MGSLRFLAAALALASLTAVATPARAECVDEVLKEKLALKRRRRGVVDRDFIKLGRHEFTIGGGYFVSDEFSATYLGTAAYTYHLTEDAAVEAWFDYTRSDATLARAHAVLAVMEGELRQRDFLAGDVPTIADVACYAYVAHAPEGNVSLADYPHIRAWLDRIEHLPRFVPMASSAVGLLAA